MSRTFLKIESKIFAWSINNKIPIFTVSYRGKFLCIKTLKKHASNQILFYFSPFCCMFSSHFTSLFFFILYLLNNSRQECKHNIHIQTKITWVGVKKVFSLTFSTKSKHQHVSCIDSSKLINL